MAAAVFTTYTALVQALHDALMDLAVNSGQIVELTYAGGGVSRTFKYRSLDEIQKAIAAFQPLADRESGVAVGRTYARNGGRG